MAKLVFILAGALVVMAHSFSLDVDSTNSELQKDLDEFLDLIPQKQIQRLAIQYFIVDKEFHELLRFVQGDDLKEFWSEILERPMTRDFVEFAQMNGLDLVDMINSVAKILGLPPYPRTVKDPLSQIIEALDADKISGGISGFFKDVEKMLPKEKLKRLFEEKCEKNPIFKKLFGILDFDRIERFMKTSEAAMKVMKFFEEFCVDVEYYFDMIREGLKVPN